MAAAVGVLLLCSSSAAVAVTMMGGDKDKPTPPPPSASATGPSPAVGPSPASPPPPPVPASTSLGSLEGYTGFENLAIKSEEGACKDDMSLAACKTMCNYDDTCLAFTYDANAKKCCPTSGTSDVKYDGDIVTFVKTVPNYNIVSLGDKRGGVIKEIQSDLEGCADACTKDYKCVGYSFSDGKCELKKSDGLASRYTETGKQFYERKILGKAPEIQWTQISGSLKQVDIDGNTACGVNSNDEIFCSNDLTSGEWTQIPGSLKHVSVSNGKLYGVNAGDGIYYKPDTSASGSWTQISGSLKQVDIDGYNSKVCGVNAVDDIYCKNDLTSVNWYQVPGKLKHVSLSDGKLYGVNANNDIYYSPDTSGSWTQIGGKLRQVDIDGSKVCGVNNENDVYCRDQLSTGEWKKMNGKMKYISISGDKYYGVKTDNTVYYGK